MSSCHTSTQRALPAHPAFGAGSRELLVLKHMDSRKLKALLNLKNTVGAVVIINHDEVGAP